MSEDNVKYVVIDFDAYGQDFESLEAAEKFALEVSEEEKNSQYMVLKLVSRIVSKVERV